MPVLVDDRLPVARLRSQWIALWLLPVFGAVLIVAFLAFPGFLPPTSPAADAESIARFYSDHLGMIRFSMITFNLCGIMLIPFFMVIVVQMKRMATPSQVLAYSYLAAVVSGATLFAIADIFWLVAAFRPERDPQLVQLLNDLAWLTFTAPVGMLVAQMVCLALAVRLDARPKPIFPRWVAAFSLAVGAAMAPAACSVIFRSGPLAWNGVVSFWIRIGAFAAFLLVMFFVVRAALLRQEIECGGAA
ncbi:hypothetical protein NONO_c46840 [Nocardia nova SH22a]|uniref:DUF4386 family protein n=1 Tax=Nocardia nova SH22a TaxID=1415166 RepID=W5TKJ2_9NOCA|nr:hypothetical protein [Nocardia nova]AHH19468.1 hypothetical protein NONO_c46840 [Nocardia nova SH22a]